MIFSSGAGTTPEGPSSVHIYTIKIKGTLKLSTLILLEELVEDSDKEKSTKTPIPPVTRGWHHPIISWGCSLDKNIWQRCQSFQRLQRDRDKYSLLEGTSEGQFSLSGVSSGTIVRIRWRIHIDLVIKIKKYYLGIWLSYLDRFCLLSPVIFHQAHHQIANLWPFIVQIHIHLENLGKLHLSPPVELHLRKLSSYHPIFLNRSRLDKPGSIHQDQYLILYAALYGNNGAF